MTALRRTVLYVPADNPRALAKAAGLAADAVVVDLEDAVAPDAKGRARAAAEAALAELSRPAAGPEVAVRINAAGTPWHDDDVALARSAGVAIVVPKVREAGDVAALAAALDGPVWPMIETAAAVLNVAAIAAASAATGPAALVLGTNDLAAELGITLGPERRELALALQQCVLGARAAGVDAIDGVCNLIDDERALRAEAEAGRAIGMTGKSVIHPSQIGTVNGVFSPSQEALADARAVCEALAEAEGQGKAVATLRGRLVERLHGEAARRLLDRAAAIAAREP